jgi:hypothetical protein
MIRGVSKSVRGIAVAYVGTGRNAMDRILCSMMAGAAGASALTLIHQAARSMTPAAPRMDVLGMRAVRATHRRLGMPEGSDREVEREALAGDIVANAAYYSLVGAGNRAGVWARGLGLGLAAGLGAVFLPRRVGLGDPPNAERLDTQLMTVAWYVAGGLAAAAAFAARDTAADARET